MFLFQVKFTIWWQENSDATVNTDDGQHRVTTLTQLMNASNQKSYTEVKYHSRLHDIPLSHSVTALFSVFCLPTWRLTFYLMNPQPGRSVFSESLCGKNKGRFCPTSCQDKDLYLILTSRAALLEIIYWIRHPAFTSFSHFSINILIFKNWSV